MLTNHGESARAARGRESGELKKEARALISQAERHNERARQQQTTPGGKAGKKNAK